MSGKKILLSIFVLIISSFVFAQDEAAIRDYIEKYKDFAVSEMQRTGVPASIKLAQGIHETFAGQSVLVQKSNNHFGIKCKAEWKGESVKHDDDARNECFRKYSSAEDSYRDHSNFLKGSDRYAFLFKLEPTDYAGWAYGLKKAGYATNPKYAPIIIKLIENYNLQDYTLLALGKIKEQDIAIAKSEPVPAEIKSVNEEVKNPGPAQPEKPGADMLTAKEQSKRIYPAGEFKINETRVIYAAKGTSFLSIAEQYNVPLSRIFEFNEMPQKEIAETDQLVYLMRKRKTGANDFHIVVPGESLYAIAQEEAIRVDALLQYNHLTVNQKPLTGEKLFLKTKAPAPPRLALEENISLSNIIAIAAPQSLKHTVAPKETIYSIARRYNVRIDDIVKWNNLPGYDLKTGQQLKIQKL